MDMQLTGMHHVSSLTADAVRNHDFYTRLLGLRLVKKSVNQDDPGMYHLFYADGVGSPGSDTTFFDYPGAARVPQGNNSITRLNFRVTGEAVLHYWIERFQAHDVPHGELYTRDGRLTLEFEDPDGTPLALIDDGGVGQSHPWEHSPVPAEYQIRGLGYTVITVPELGPTDSFLTAGLSMRQVRQYPEPSAPRFIVYVYEMGEGGPAAEVHVAVRNDLPRARYGAGSVHHLALRVPDYDQHRWWIEHLSELGYGHSGHVDRFWFKSVYVREPNGVLFELATDGPGFAVDEDLSALGESLVLPPRLEPYRSQIETRLRPLNLPQPA